VQAAYIGPLPPSSEFARYDQVVPGAGERILRVMEKEQAHRQELQRQQQSAALEAARAEIDFRTRLAGRGQILGFAGMLLALAFGSVAMWLGHTVLAGTVVTTTLLGILAAFGTSRSSDKKAGPPKPPQQPGGPAQD
jgi:uncharacterized membrane protein